MDFSKDYSQRFDSRRERHISNLAELASIAHPGGPEIFDALPALISSRSPNDPIDAMRWSILVLWLQATECYILGQFEPCILASGAVMERCLKLEYRVANGSWLSGRWTLGKCIHEIDWSNTKVTADHIESAKACLDPRNSRAHALLEHSNPQLSMLGGKRGINILSPYHYTFEAYRGEASKVIANTWTVLAGLYSGKDDPSNSQAA